MLVQCLFVIQFEMSYMSLNSEHSIVLNYFWEISAALAGVFIVIRLIQKISKQYEVSRSGQSSQKRNIAKPESDEEEFIDDDDISPSLGNIEYIPFVGATKTLQGGAVEFNDIMQNRRSVRSFSSESVDIEIIKKCIQAAGSAPSGAHTEPWVFCIVVRWYYWNDCFNYLDMF